MQPSKPKELATAVVPKGLAALAAHLVTMGEHDSLVRMDDWHMNMALGILANPQVHLDALIAAGVAIPQSADDTEDKTHGVIHGK